MATNNIKAIQQSQKIVLVGNGVSGKTCLLTSFLHNQFDSKEDSAIRGEYDTEIHLDGKSVRLNVLDTCGASDFDRLRSLYYVNADIVLICFGVDDPESTTEIIERWIPEVTHYSFRCPVILVACKTDLRTDPDTIAKLKQQGTKPISKKVGKKMASKSKVDAYMECSAKTGEGVRDLFVQATILSFKKHAPREK